VVTPARRRGQRPSQKHGGNQLRVKQRKRDGGIAMTEEKSPKLTPEQISKMNAALQSPVIKLYANGFLMGQSASDVVVVLTTNGAPSGILNLSYISAKSLSNDLSKLITEFETATGEKVPTAKEVGEKMTKAKGPGTDVTKR
jgi:hypothetical protein